MEWYKNIWTPRSMVIIFIQFKGKEAQLTALKCKRKQTQMPDTMHFDTVEDVIKHFGNSVPYHLHVMGTGVLSRKTVSIPTYKEELVISGNFDDFIFTTYNDGTTIAASFFRKELIAAAASEIEEQKLHVLGITSGSVPLFTLIEEEEITFDFMLSKRGDKIQEFKRAESAVSKITWRDAFFTQKQLLAKALFSSLRSSNEHYANSEEDKNGTAKENYRQFSQFKTFGVAMLSMILLALMVNYFYQNSLNSQIAQLELDLSISNDNLSLLDRLEQEKLRKEQLVFNAGVNTSRFLSFYLDEIGRTVPKNINLHELNVFPLESKLKNKHKIEVDKESIRISGSTADNEVLDDWIEKMDRFEWIKSIELLNYLKNEQERADFKLIIRVSN